MQGEPHDGERHYRGVVVGPSAEQDSGAQRTNSPASRGIMEVDAREVAVYEEDKHREIGHGESGGEGGKG